MKNKRGVSPIIATVLLISIVVVLALIIFLWARGFVTETISKNGVPADQVCDEISLEVLYIDDELQVTNLGNTPVYGLEIRKTLGASIETEREQGIAAGQSASINIGAGYDEIEVFPSILGQGRTSKKEYTCKRGFIA